MNVDMLIIYQWYEGLGCFLVVFDAIVICSKQKQNRIHILYEKLDEFYDEIDKLGEFNEFMACINELTRLLADFSIFKSCLD